jgi:energy-converting hydrogenase A subunit D
MQSPAPVQEGQRQMIEILLIGFGCLVIIGALATIWEKDPFNKLIALSVMIGGIIPFIINRQLVDVAIAVALIAPLSTIFILMVARRNT